MNWKDIIFDLIESGLTQKQIADEIGAQQPTIAYLLSGKQKNIKYETGHRLAQLHLRSATGKAKHRASHV